MIIQLLIINKIDLDLSTGPPTSRWKFLRWRVRTGASSPPSLSAGPRDQVRPYTALIQSTLFRPIPIFSFQG